MLQTYLLTKMNFFSSKDKLPVISQKWLALKELGCFGDLNLMA